MSKLAQSILRACAAATTRWPWAVLAVAAVLTALAAYASTRLSVDTSTDDILSAELPFRQIEIAYDADFPQEDLAVAVVDGETADQAEAAARELVEQVGARPDFFEHVSLAGASPYFDRYGLLFLEPGEIEEFGNEIRQARRLLASIANDPTLRGVSDLLGLVRTGVEESAAPPAASDLLTMLAATVQARAEGRPAEMQWRDLFGFNLDPDSTRRIVEMKPILNDTSLDRAGPALDALDSAISEVEARHPGVSVRVTGEPVLRQQELTDAFSGAAYASSFSFVLVALSLIIGIRSGRLIAALLITLVIGSLWTTGLAAITVGRLNLISIAFLVLFIGLGVDFGTHLGLRHLEAARKGKPFKEALVEAMLAEGPSITLSGICAALAFLAFVPTSYTGLAEFGIISALGMLVAVVVTFTVQPALMTLMPPRPQVGREVTIGIGGFIQRYYRLVLVLAVVATAFAAYEANNVRIDTNPLNLQNPDTEAYRTYRDLASDPDTSPYFLDVTATDLDAAAELAPRLAELSGVLGVRYLGDFIPENQEEKLAALVAARERIGESFFVDEPEATPTDAELIEAFEAMRTDAAAIGAVGEDNPLGPVIPHAGAELAAALEEFAEQRGAEPAALQELGAALASDMPEIVADLRTKFSVSEAVTIEEIPTDLRAEWLTEDGRARIRVLPDEDIGTASQMQVFAERIQTIAPEAAGAPASVTGAGMAILRAFAEAIAYTVIAIGLIVVIVRRRISDVLLILAPLAVAALWTVAASAYLDLPFNFANIIVIPLLIGLGVASSIHIVSRAHEVVHDSTGDHEEGMHVLDTSTPLAVLVAQLNTVAAFATLSLAEHRGLFSMGVLLGLAILFVLVVSLIVLPSFMLAIGMQRTDAGQAPAGPTV